MGLESLLEYTPTIITLHIRFVKKDLEYMQKHDIRTVSENSSTMCRSLNSTKLPHLKKIASDYMYNILENTECF